MKTRLAAVFFAGAVLLSGCATHQPSVVLAPVGPSPPQPAPGGPKGTLVVYSAYDPNSDFNDTEYLRQYTDYRILSEEGKLLQTVHNSNGFVVEGPAEVELPAGKYRIIAQANGYKKNVIVPVVVLADRLTTVHLEGEAAWPANAALLQSNPVRLPNGEIVGWPASTEVVSKP